MIVYYRESNGDYLAIETEANDFYRRTFGHDHFGGRATAIAGLVGSICTTGISRTFLKVNCRRVSKGTVPSEWLRAIGF